MQNLAGSAFFFAPRGMHFQLVPLGFLSRIFHGQIFTPDKHKIIASNLNWLKYSLLKFTKNLFFDADRQKWISDTWSTPQKT